MRKAQLRAEARVKARIAAQDTDGDGMLSAAELALPRGPQGMFDRRITSYNVCYTKLLRSKALRPKAE